MVLGVTMNYDLNERECPCKLLEILFSEWPALKGVFSRMLDISGSYKT